MTIEKEILLKKLSSIKAGLSTKDIIEYGNYFIFTGDEIITYNDQLSIGVAFKSEFIQGAAIPADEFLQILARIKSDTVDLDFADGVLKIKSGRVSAELKCLWDQDIDFIKVLRPGDKKLKWKSLPDDFREGLLMTIFSTSSDMTKAYLTCLNIQNEYITSSDNLRISKFTFKNKIDDSFLLPALAAKELVKFKDIKKYCIDESWAFFKDEADIIFCARIVDGEFPDVTSFFDVEGEEFSFPKTTIDSIDTASVFAEGDYDFEKKIQITIKNKKMICKGEREIGWIKEESKINIEHDFSFVINPFFFGEVLKHTSNAKISDNVVLFYSENFQHLIMLFSEEE